MRFVGRLVSSASPASPASATGAAATSAMICPPGTSTLPVMAMSATMHWPAWLPFWFWSRARPQAMVAGLAVA